MEGHMEKSVDPNLDTFLNKDLPTNTIREGVTPGEEFASIDDKPINNKTKGQILHYIAKGTNPEEAHKLIDVIERLEEMPQEKAETILKGLRAISDHGVDKNLVRYLVKELTHVFYNPVDKKRKRSAKNDKFILSCGSDGLNEIFGTLGWLSGVIVFGIYGIASWRNFDEASSITGNKKQKTEESKDDSVIE